VEPGLAPPGGRSLAVLGFLGAIAFRREGPVYGGWIFLDFLGFSRLNRDFSMGYEARGGEDFSRAPPWREWPRNGALVVWPTRKAGLVMGRV